MRCERCESGAETAIITRSFGTEHVCLACAIAILADRQCDNIVQPPQPPDIIGRVNLMRARHGRDPIVQ